LKTYLWYMKKNSRIFTIIANIVGWLIFLAIPLLFISEPPPELKQEFGKLYLLPIFTSSFFLILLFYFNYYFLVPKFLFTNRYIIYILSCLACIGIKFIFPVIMMFLFPKPHHPLPIDYLPHPKFLMHLQFGNSVLMHVVILLASIGLRLNKRWELTEQEKLQSELALLKSQVNPHFLFNTLNGIYAATLGKADNASEMIIKLSDIMRYTISEAHLDSVPLQKEINYISNYIELQKLRLSSKVSLEYTVKGEASDYEIAPLLLIPFVENAFKYGVNPELDSSIFVLIEINGSELQLKVYNSKVEIESTLQETTGLGIENTRLRLNLIYPGKHKLEIEETESSYSVSLYISLI